MPIILLDRPPPRLTDWMSRGSKTCKPAHVSPPTCGHEVDVHDLPLGAPAGTWQVSRSGRYLATGLPCPYLPHEPLARDGKPVARRRKPQGAVESSSSRSTASSVRPLRRSRSVPPQTAARSRQSPLAAACRAYASARKPPGGGPGRMRTSAVLDSIIAADALRLEESLAEYCLELSDAQSYREVWARIASAAEAVGVDSGTYAQLWSLQLRDIEPEDYDVLQRLQASVPPRTLREEHLSAFPTAYVGSRGQLIGKGGQPRAHGPGLAARLPAGSSADGFCAGLQCTVCLEDFRLGEQVRVLPCRHFFHQACIDSWLTGSSVTCPVDGMAVSVEEEGAGAPTEVETAGDEEVVWPAKPSV